MINAVILEDDPALGKSLALMIKEYCPEVTVIALLDSGEMALDILPSIQYDFIFSDIDLGDMDAFTLFKKLDKPNQHIIFTTSYENFAVEAFKLDAIDYLVKPIYPDALIRGVNRVLERIANRELPVSHKDNLELHKGGKILYRAAGQLHVISNLRIIYFEAQGSYTKVYLDDGSEPKLIPNHLKQIEETLPENKFYRIHNSLIINSDFVDHILFQNKVCVLKNNGSLQKIHLKIADRKFQGFMDFLKKS